jgi:hypothetical protein
MTTIRERVLFVTTQQLVEVKMFAVRSIRGFAARGRQTIFAALLIIALFGIVPGASVQAAGSYVGYFQSSVVCSYGSVTLQYGITGAYDNQWVAVRRYVWSNNVYLGVSNWEVIQVTGPGVFVMGGNISLEGIVRGSVIKMATEVYFWNPNTNLWEYGGKKYANHYQWYIAIPATSCLIG